MRIVLVIAAVLLTGCTLFPAAGSPPAAGEPPTPVATSASPTTVSVTAAPPDTEPTTTTTIPLPPGVVERPDWLGTRVLPLRPDGFGEMLPTPPEMVDRRFATVDLLPPPSDGAFAWTIGSVTPEVAARSTWRPECPVTLDELRYITVSFWGFDERPHTGEMIVNAAVAEDMIGVFGRLFEARFPIEEMRVIRYEEIDEPPTGDGNVTSSLECREATGGTSWSRHSYGLAVDINPFHNPYLKNDVVLPELATAYTDRTDVRPGMVTPGDVVVQAFADIGWGWGGNWSSLKDWMHFSDNGR